MHALSPATLIGVLTIDDSDDTRTELKEFRKFTKAANLKLFIAKDRKHSEQIIADLKPDLCFVVGWFWLLSRTLLDDLRCEFIGIHTSLLPKFRGGSPLVWSIINGDKIVGTTFFSFTPRMDDGPVWAQSRVKVNKDDYISCILDKLENKTVQVFHRKYLSVLKGAIVPVEQNHLQATYCMRRFPKDGNIDWHRSSGYVYNFIRAQSDPYPGAFTYLDGQMIKIFKARLFKGLYYGVPGQIARITNDGVYVICADNTAIILEEVQIGPKRGQAKDFIKSIGARCLCPLI